MSSPNSQSDRQKIRLYFLDPRLRYAFVPLLLGLILVEIFLGKFFLLIGFTWLGAALLLDRSRPSDQELEELLASDVQPLVEKALQSLDPRDDEMQGLPLVLRGPIELATPAFRQFLTRPRTGKDGNRRSPVNRVVILLPLEDHLGLYSCQRDSLNDQTTQVSIESHHYRDVVWLALEKDVEPAAGQATGTGQIFSLELKNGRRLSVRVAAGSRGEEARNDHGSLSSMEKTIRAIQVLMRDRK